MVEAIFVLRPIRVLIPIFSAILPEETPHRPLKLTRSEAELSQGTSTMPTKAGMAANLKRKQPEHSPLTISTNLIASGLDSYHGPRPEVQVEQAPVSSRSVYVQAYFCAAQKRISSPIKL